MQEMHAILGVEVITFLAFGWLPCLATCIFLAGLHTCIFWRPVFFGESYFFFVHKIFSFSLLTSSCSCCSFSHKKMKKHKKMKTMEVTSPTLQYPMEYVDGKQRFKVNGKWMNRKNMKKHREEVN
jgi:hypothetical protein